MQTKLLINGKLVAGEGKVEQVLNPATGKVFARVSEATRGQVDAAFVTSCDAPLLRPGLVSRLVELLGKQEAAAPRIDGRWYPLMAVYRVTVLSHVERMLDQDQRRMSDLLVACRAREITRVDLAAMDPALDSLRSCNTPAEYAQALALDTSP